MNRHAVCRRGGITTGAVPYRRIQVSEAKTHWRSESAFARPKGLNERFRDASFLAGHVRNRLRQQFHCFFRNHSGHGRYPSF